MFEAVQPAGLEGFAGPEGLCNLQFWSAVQSDVAEANVGQAASEATQQHEAMRGVHEAKASPLQDVE